MTRGKQRANGRTGLWQDTPQAPYVPAHDLRTEQETSPRRRTCHRQHGGCGATPGEPCTSPSRRQGARRPINGYHQARLNPQENP